MKDLTIDNIEEIRSRIFKEIDDLKYKQFMENDYVVKAYIDKDIRLLEGSLSMYYQIIVDKQKELNSK